MREGWEQRGFGVGKCVPMIPYVLTVIPEYFRFSFRRGFPVQLVSHSLEVVLGVVVDRSLRLEPEDRGCRRGRGEGRGEEMTGDEEKAGGEETVRKTVDRPTSLSLC